MVSPLEVVRIVVGSVYVLFAPGLAWSFIFFPRVRPIEAPKETPGIDWIERVAISFGLSVALVPLSVFFLNFFLKVPINTWSVILIVALLSAAPLGYLYWKRKNPPRAGAEVPGPSATATPRRVKE